MDSPMGTVKKHWGELEPLCMHMPIIDDEDVQEEANENAWEDYVTQLGIVPLKVNQRFFSEDEEHGSHMELPSECSQMEENVLGSVKILEQLRQCYDSSGQSAMSDLLLRTSQAMETNDPISSVKNTKKTRIKEEFTTPAQNYRPSSFAQGHCTPPIELRPQAARQILQKSVATLLAHTGYSTATLSALETITDVVQCFMSRLTQMLRFAADQESDAGPRGFPETVEWAFCSAGLGSITTLHSYYQNEVLARRSFLESEAEKHVILQGKMLKAEEESIRVITKEEDPEISEIHFSGLGDAVATEEMQSTLESGFQMLHTLEEEALS